MIANVFAALGLLTCLLLALRMALPASRQRQVDAALRRAWARLRELAFQLRHWRRHRQHSKQAAAEAAELIRRAKARDEVDRDGNVYRPKQFDPKKRRDLH
ncbi:hypothetical protein [Paucibacter sp. DJ2R-2]|uniref:hypothetical protein n=1 Tax=Paucibacter sp. DJ2R-2 TaxID=2893558 RepID=UPI0021E49973|nr:hypothetical protein [Paucibacter sp. DJ2R-2]MCV2420066.1 hypothetical protein [Paucibacter sp. DJ4R-1]MCV2437007.1 hypothetical protein [Paucibacter sp. DJ2R-2]